MSQRGSQARDNGQAAEFHKILDHPGVVENPCHWRAWRIQFGEAQAMPSAARKSHQDFFVLWKDAGIPILRQAKAEYANPR